MLPLDQLKNLTPKYLKQHLTAEFENFLLFFGSDEFIDTFHGDLARWLQSHTPEKGKKARLLIMMPRGYIKTRTVTVLYSLWRYVRDQEERILVVSNTSLNAESMVGLIREFFERNDQFRALFPELIPTTFHYGWSNVRAICPRKGNYMEGTFDSCGVGANVTGRHYTMIVEDDTISPALDDLTGEMYVPRKDEIEKAVGWHRIAEPLLVNPGADTRVVVGTRWAEDDLIGSIVRDEKYDVFKLACVDNIPSDGDWRLGHPIYFRYPLERLELIHSTLGDYFFNSLYLNDPLPNASRLFKAEYFRYFDEEDVPGDAYRVLCVDPAVSEQEAADFTGFTVCAHSPGALFVLHASHGKLPPSEVINRALTLCQQYDVRHLRMETIALAQTFIEGFRQAIFDRQLGIYFEPIKSVRGSKIERILSLEPFFQNGQVFMRKSQVELATELLRFNAETFERQRQKIDIADSLSMHIPIFRSKLRSVPKQVGWDGRLTYEWLEKQCKGLRKYHGDVKRHRGLSASRLG